MRPTWVEVSLSNLRRNFRRIRQLVGPEVTVCAVVKADAYGHGAIVCARALEREGASFFGVTCTEEGVRLREAGIRGRILLMTGFWQGEAEEVVLHRLTPALWEPWQVQELQNSAQRFGKRAVPIHLKVDTGMRRLGVGMSELAHRLRQIQTAKHLKLEGVFTHLASAEILGAPDVEAQARHFAEIQRQVLQAGCSPTYWHMANSAAILSRPSTWYNLVRPGISLYGYTLPFVDVQGNPVAVPGALSLTPVLSWKTRIIALRCVEANQGIGYDGAYITRKPTLLATIPVGYGDGLDRRLSSRGHVLVRGAVARIVGNVCMDITLLDVTNIPGVAVGDEVTLIGADATRRLTANESADCQGSISYEVLCSIGKRVPRVYGGMEIDDNGNPGYTECGAWQEGCIV
jgi:alanine racemase